MALGNVTPNSKQRLDDSNNRMVDLTLDANSKFKIAEKELNQAVDIVLQDFSTEAALKSFFQSSVNPDKDIDDFLAQDVQAQAILKKVDELYQPNVVNFANELQDIKDLKMILTSEGYLHLTRNVLVTDCSCKKELAASFLRDYIAELRDGDASDDGFFKDELRKVLAGAVNIQINGVPDNGVFLDEAIFTSILSDNLVLKEVVVDANNQISCMSFVTADENKPLQTVLTPQEPSISPTSPSPQVNQEHVSQSIPQNSNGGGDVVQQEASSNAILTNNLIPQNTGFDRDLVDLSGCGGLSMDVPSPLPAMSGGGANTTTGIGREEDIKSDFTVTPGGLGKGDAMPKGASAEEQDIRPTNLSSVAYGSEKVFQDQKEGKQNRDIASERKALRRLIRGSMDLLIRDPDPKANPVEVKELRELKRSINSFGLNNFAEVFAFVIETYNRGERNISKNEFVSRAKAAGLDLKGNNLTDLFTRDGKMLQDLFRLYKGYRENKTQYPYLHSLLGQFEDTLRADGASGDDVVLNTYNNLNERNVNLLGKTVMVDKDGNNMTIKTREKQSLRYLDNELMSEGTNVAIMKKIVKSYHKGEIDLDKIVNYQKYMKNDKKRGFVYTAKLNKEEEKIYALYMRDIQAMNPDDKNASPTALVTLLRGLHAGMSVQEIANTKMVHERGVFMNIIENGAEIEGGAYEEKLMKELANSRTDARVDVADNNTNHTSGQQFLAVYRSTKEQIAYQKVDAKIKKGTVLGAVDNREGYREAELQIVANLLGYVQHTAKNMGDYDAISKPILSILRDQDGDGKIDVENLARDMIGPNGLFDQHPYLKKYMTDVVRNTAVPLMSYVMRYGAGAYERYTVDVLNTQSEQVLSPEQLQQINSFTQQQRGEMQKKAQTLGTPLSPTDYDQFRAQFVQFAADAAAAGGFNCQQFLKEFDQGGSLSLNTGLVATNYLNKPQGYRLGVTISYNKPLDHGWNLDASAGAGYHLNMMMKGLGKAGFFLSFGGSKTWTLNEAEALFTNKAINKLTIGAHAGLSGALPTATLSLGRHKDYLANIDGAYQKVLAQSTDVATKSLNAIRWPISPADYQRNIDAISKAISFLGKSDSALAHRAAYNIYRAIVGLGCKDARSAVPQIANYFATQWKNERMQELTRGVKFTGVDVSFNVLSVMAGMVPMFMVGPQFTKFSGVQYTDNPGSAQLAQLMAESGVGYESVSSTVGDRELSLVNTTIARFFAEGYAPYADPTDIALAFYEGYQDSKDYISIPKALIDNDIITLSLASNMKGKILDTGDSYVVSKYAGLYPYHIFQHGKQSLVLGVGAPYSRDARKNGLVLQRGRDKERYVTPWLFTGEGKLPHPAGVEQNKNEITSEAINAQILGLTAKGIPLQNVVFDSASQTLTFSLNGVVSTVPKGHKITITKNTAGLYTASSPITDAAHPKDIGIAYEFEQKIETCDLTTEALKARIAESVNSELNAIFVQDSLSFDNATKKLTLPLESGVVLKDASGAAVSGSLVVDIAKKVLFTKIADKQYTYTVSDLPTNGIELSYQSNATNTEAVNINASNIFKDLYDDIDTQVSSNLKNLANIDDAKTNKPQFVDFMKNLSNATEGSYIDEGKVKASIDALNTMIGTNSFLNSFKTFVATLSTMEQKAYLCNQLKTVFAYEVEGMNELKIYNSRRGNENYVKNSGGKFRFETITGPSGDGFPLDHATFDGLLDLKKTLGKDTKYNTNAVNNTKNNLLGYTAFYQRGVDADARKYSMTAPGMTAVYQSVGGHEYIQDISSEKQTDVKKWILKNFEANYFEQNMLVSSLHSLLATSLADNPTLLAECKSYITQDSVVDFLRDGKIITTTGLVMEINTKPVAYLCAHCLNESLGLMIDSLKVSKTVDGVTQSVSATCAGHEEISRVSDGDFTIHAEEFTKYTGKGLAMGVSESRSSASTVSANVRHAAVGMPGGTQGSNPGHGAEGSGLARGSTYTSLMTTV